SRAIRPNLHWTRPGALWSAERINTALRPLPSYIEISLGFPPTSIDMRTRDDKIDFMKSSGLTSSRDAARALFCLLFLPFALVFSSDCVLAQSDGGANDPRVSKLYADAKAAESRGDFAGAAASYESLLQVAPRLAPAYNNLGSLYLRRR